jgi:hypothetical protein
VQIIYSQYVPLSQSRQFSNSIPLKVFCDAEVQKVFDAQNGPGVHTVAMPHILSPEQYAQQIHPLIDKLTAPPVA